MKKVIIGFLLICGLISTTMASTPIFTNRLDLYEISQYYTTSNSNETLLTPYQNIPFYLETGSSWFDPSMAVLDLNHDGSRDFVFVQLNPDYFIAMNASGDVYWRKAFINSYVFTGDFDRDGYIDDIISYDLSIFSESEIRAWNESGEAIDYTINGSIHYSHETFSCNVHINEYIGDLNSDGYLDDFIFKFNNASGHYYSAMNYFSRRSLWNFSVEAWAFAISLLPLDLNHNGYADNVFLSTSKNKTYAIDNDGTLLWSLESGGEWPQLTHAGAIGDLDHNGFMDNVVFISPHNASIYALDSTGNVLWDFPTENASAVRTCDYDNDGFRDEVCVAETTRLLILDEVGAVIKAVPTSFSLHRLIVENATDDGLVDFLLSGDRLAIVNHSGDILWAVDYGASNIPIATADFNGNGVANESLWLIGGEMFIFRWGAPNITITFMDAPNLTIPVGSPEVLRLNITSYEPYLAVTLNYTIDGSTVEFTINPQSSVYRNWLITLDVVGNATYEAELKYYGVVFCTDTIIVFAVEQSIPMHWWWVGVALILVLAVGFFRRRFSFEKLN